MGHVTLPKSEWLELPREILFHRGIQVGLEMVVIGELCQEPHPVFTWARCDLPKGHLGRHSAPCNHTDVCAYQECYNDAVGEASDGNRYCATHLSQETSDE